MRFYTRLLAARLPANSPTGLTGLLTHPKPRPVLVAIYNATLERLKEFPEHSVYRQSTEALTRKRLAAVTNAKPDGWDEWAAKHEAVEKEVKKAIEEFNKSKGLGVSGARESVVEMSDLTKQAIRRSRENPATEDAVSEHGALEAKEEKPMSELTKRAIKKSQQNPATEDSVAEHGALEGDSTDATAKLPFAAKKGMQVSQSVGSSIDAASELGALTPAETAISNAALAEVESKISSPDVLSWSQLERAVGIEHYAISPETNIEPEDVDGSMMEMEESDFEKRNATEVGFMREQLKEKLRAVRDQEPDWSAEQVGEVERAIGAGLVEEVVEVAGGELQLVEELLKKRPWEALEESPEEGQWVYFERK